MKKLLLVTLLLTGLSASALAKPMQSETDLAALQSNSIPALHQLAVKTRKTQQISQEAGDYMAEVFLLRSQNPAAKHSQALAHTATALGSLNHDRYRTVLTKVAKEGKNKHARKYAAAALKRLPKTDSAQYQPHSVKVNVGIANVNNTPLTKAQQQQLNRLKSGKIADAEKVSREINRDGFTHVKVSDALALMLLDHAQHATEDTNDSIAWMARALGNLGHARYAHMMMEMQINMGLSLHVAKHVLMSLRRMGCPNVEQFQFKSFAQEQYAQLRNSEPAELNKVIKEVTLGCYAGEEITDALIEVVHQRGSDAKFSKSLNAAIKALANIGYDRYRQAFEQLEDSNISAALKKDIKAQLKRMPETRSQQYRLGSKKFKLS